MYKVLTYEFANYFLLVSLYFIDLSEAQVQEGKSVLLLKSKDLDWLTRLQKLFDMTVENGWEGGQSHGFLRWKMKRYYCYYY